MSEIKVSKVYSLGEQPSKNLEGTIWADTTNESAPILKRADSSGVFRDFTIPHLDSGKVIIPTGPGTSTTLNERLSVIGNALLEIDSNVAAKANDADVIKVTGGTITDGSLVINDTYVYEEHCSSNLGLQVTGKYHDLNTGEYVDVSTNINPAVITGDAVTSSIIPTSEKLLTSGGAYTALQTKVNKGSLHFNGGVLSIGKSSNSEAYSHCFTMSYSYEDFLNTTNGASFAGTCFYNTGNNGWFLYNNSSATNKRLDLISYNKIATSGTYTTLATGEDIKKFFDGTPKKFVVVRDSVNTRLYLDNVLIRTMPISANGPDDFLKFGYRANTTGSFTPYFVGQVSDVAVFNFDITAEDAPYTLEDYQNNKIIPPSLRDGHQVEMASFTREAGTTAVGSYSNGVFTLSGTSVSSSSMVRVKTPFVARAGEYIVIKNSAATLTGQAAGLRLALRDDNNNTSNDIYALTTEHNIILKLTRDITKIAIWADFTSIGTAGIPVGGSCELEIKKVGANLALENYTINDKVLDYSGNKNHATITGNVIGDNDNSILIQTEEILKDTATLSQLETKADKTELNNKQDTLLYYSEDEMGATLSAFDIDLAAGERAELSTSYGNELILRAEGGITLNITDNKLAKFNGSAIATTIDSSVGNAHNKLPTAKAVYDAIKDINITPVNTLDLVLTSSSNKVYAVTPKIENNIPVLTIELQEGNTSTYKPCYILGEDGSSIYLLEVDGDRGSETFIVSNVSNSVSNINTNGIGLLIKGSDGINYNLVPAGEVGYEYYTLSCIKDSTPVVSINLDNGDAIINENTVYLLIIDSDTNFVLPEQKAGSFAQILVCAKITSDVNIDFGTTHFFNDEIPTIETNNNYDILFEHDPIENVWVCGTIKKG